MHFFVEVLPYAETKYSRRSTVGRPSMSYGPSSPASRHSVMSVRSQRGAGSMSPSKHRMDRKRGIRPMKSVKSARSLYRASRKQSTVSIKPSAMDVNKESKSVVQDSGEEGSTTSILKSKQVKSTTSSKSSKHSDEGSGDDEGVEKDEEDSDVKTKRGKESRDLDENSESLQDFMLAYGVPSDQDLSRDWQAFKSHLVEKVYEENGVSWIMSSVK